MASNARPIGALTRSVVAEIRATLARLDKPQAWLAERSGVPESTLKKILRYERPIDMEQLDRIAQSFEITPDELVASALRSGGLYQPIASAVHDGRSSQGDTPNDKHPDDGWEVGAASDVGMEILRADAEANPD